MPAITLMIQGTTSDAGKSLVTAALCRLLCRQGVRVVPFKPQNMSLNSAVTPEGGEIGRAQALQAQAACLTPHSDMNPILLKPNTDIGTQVIVHGQPLSNMDAVHYHQFKAQAMEYVLQSYERLAKTYDVIVVEGAGSPAEINLRQGDIANMGFAEQVDCPVILVGDIDRGGVFAHLVGTLDLLSPSEQNRVVGFIINKFRGDITLLESGLHWLEQKTGKPVLGVLPMIPDLFLPEEDGFFWHHQQATTNSQVDQHRGRVVVPLFPRISNHTDLDPLRNRADIELILVGDHHTVEFPPADLIILPGSKSVRSDLAWLKSKGWNRAIQRHLRYGGKLLGICGGFQMLGRAIHDPHGLEGKAGSSKGLDFLNMNTTLDTKKQLAQKTGNLLWGKLPVVGYEIHHGLSSGEALQHPLLQFDDGQQDGAISADEQIIGCYLHGLLDQSEVLATILTWANLSTTREAETGAKAEKKPAMATIQTAQEASLNKLADVFETHINHPTMKTLIPNMATTRFDT